MCPACDADRPAAGAFVRWYQDAGRDPKPLACSRTGRRRPWPALP
ncbi:DUF6300 family protein [Streptomyces sp. YIM S03343]